MKVALAALILAIVAVFPAVSQDAASQNGTQESTTTTPIWDHGDNVSNITYTNLEIQRIYDQKDAYIVIYSKNHGVDIGHTVIPKSWTDNSSGARKLNFREVPPGLNPYMTVITQNGEFLKVWLSVPVDRFNPIWAIAPHGTEVSGTDSETLQIEY